MASISPTLVAIAAAAASGLFYLSQSTHVAASATRSTPSQARLADLRAEQQQLTFQIGEARSPSTIEAMAQNRAAAGPARHQPSSASPSTSTDPALLK